MNNFNINNLTPKKRAVLIIIAIVLILSFTFGATFAWLKDQKIVNNEFTTTANLSVVIDESDAQYLLMPNTPIAKNPTVSIAANQEPSYVFMKPQESSALSDYIDYYVHNDWQQYGSFVIDGELDDLYQKTQGWYFDSRTTTYPGLEAYYSSDTYHSGSAEDAYYKANSTFAQTYQPLADVITKGADSDKAQLATEIYLAYDHDYVYVYTKVYDNDYYKKGAQRVSDNQSDYLGIYWDPDPDSRENVDYEQYADVFYPDGTLVDEPLRLSYQKKVPTQGEMEVKFFPADNQYIAAIPTSGGKVGYGTDSATSTISDYFKAEGDCANAETPNRVFFEFTETVNGTEYTAGYGYELRLPRNDSYYDTTENGNPYFKMSIAVTNFADAYEDQMTLAFGKSFWLSYDNMLSFELNDEDNPFFTDNGGESGIYYKVIGDTATGLTTEATEIPVLRGGACYGSAYADGYVYVKDNVTAEMNDNVGTSATLRFDTYIIQQANLPFDDAYQQAVNKFNS